MITRTYLIYVTIITMFGFSIQSCKKDYEQTEPEFSLDQPDQISDDNYEIYSLFINETYTSDEFLGRRSLFVSGIMYSLP